MRKDESVRRKRVVREDELFGCGCLDGDARSRRMVDYGKDIQPPATVRRYFGSCGHCERVVSAILATVNGPLDSTLRTVR
jgi:hypothetical protein